MDNEEIEIQNEFDELEEIDEIEDEVSVSLSEDEEDEMSYISNSIVSNDETYINQNSNNLKTSPFLGKLELTKILSIRTQMLARGSPKLVEIPMNMSDPYEIAKLELQQKKCPLMIRRYFPDNKYVDVKVSDLIIKHSY
tara:strand:- start:363 stop:779 length:417 start_codon:yes stop_codon:yes gene_type:complete